MHAFDGHPRGEPLADGVGDAPQTRVEHGILRRNDHPRRQPPNQIGEDFADVFAAGPEFGRVLGGSAANRISGVDETVEDAQKSRGDKDEP